MTLQVLQVPSFQDVGDGFVGCVALLDTFVMAPFPANAHHPVRQGALARGPMPSTRPAGCATYSAGRPGFERVGFVLDSMLSNVSSPLLSLPAARAVECTELTMELSASPPSGSTADRHQGRVRVRVR